jgi:replicative DNA helicase
VSLQLSTPEERLLGLVLSDNRCIEYIPDGVTGAQFADARAGMIFDKAMAAIAAGHHVDSIWAANLVVDDPDIHNVEPELIWPLTDVLSYAPQATDYANAVAKDATRRSLASVMNAVNTGLAAGGDPAEVASNAVRWAQEVVDGTASTGLCSSWTTPTDVRADAPGTVPGDRR